MDHLAVAGTSAERSPRSPRSPRLRVISALSGDTLAEVECLEEHTVRLLKEQLEPILHVTRFCQRIRCEDQELEEHEIFPDPTKPAVLACLAFGPPDDEDWQKLCAACRLNMPDMLEGMLRCPVDPNLEGIVKRRALHFAAGNGHVKCISLLLEAKADKDAACSDDGATALHLAASQGKVMAVQQLLEAAADLEKAMLCGRRALHYAASHGQVEVLQMLLDAGAQKDAFTGAPERATALACAAAQGRSQVMRVLIEAAADVNAQPAPAPRSAAAAASPLHMAATGGFTEAVRMLLAAGAKKDLSFNGVLPLHVAARFGHADVVQLLLEAAADGSAVTTHRHTALDLAVQQHHHAVVRLLERAAGSDPTTG